MKAQDEEFLNLITGMTHEELLDFALTEHVRLRELEVREASNNRINTEVHIQFTRMQDENRALKKELQEVKEQLLKEIEKNMLKTRSTYGRSTEKLLDIISSSADKAEDFEDESQEEDDGQENGARIIGFPSAGKKTGDEGGSEKTTGNGKGTEKGTKRQKSLKKSLERLPKEIVYLLDVDLLNTLYGEGEWRIAFWREHMFLERIPVSYYARYILTPVISEGLGHFLHTVPFYNLLLPHSYASASIVADILYRKFVLSLPFYRQAMDYNLSGIDLGKQVMIHWANTIVPGFLERVRDHMAAILILSGYIQSDESYLQVNKDGKAAGHQSFIWVHCTSELLDCPPVIVFYYEATRGTDHLRKLFGEFLGYITCDAYISYQVIEKENGEITVTGCFMHCRRYFAEALFVNDLSSMSDEDLSDLPETKALLLVREIYAEEKPLKDLSAEERLAARQKKVRPKVDAFFEYIHALDGSGDVLSERLKKAVQYAVNQEEKLREFLNDGNVPCDNGFSERIIRAYSIGRANWLFADTITGANVNAVMYSIVETAKANGTDVRIYIQYLLERIPAAEENGEINTPGFMDRMMPWSREYREYEKDIKQSALSSFRNLFPEPLKPKTPSRRAINESALPLEPKEADSA